MRRYGWRALGLFLAALAAVGMIAWLAGSPALAKESAAECAAEAPVETEKAEDAAEEDGQLLLHSETARETVSLYSETWKQLKRVRLDSAGKGTVPFPGAGTYHLIRGGGATMTIQLSEDGTVTVLSGNGWGNGAVLELTETLRGSVAVRYHGEAGSVCRLEGESTARQETMEAGETEEENLALCRFDGLKPGRYQLYVGDEWVVSVSVTDLSPDRSVELY